MTTQATPERMEVPLALIDGSDDTFRFRLEYPESELRPLAQSMAREGLLNPVKLRKKGDKFQVIAGWERLYAAELQEWESVPADVYDGISDSQAYYINFADNQLRSPLSELETSNQVAKLRFGLEMPVEEITERFGWGTQRVYDLLKLQEMKPEIQDAVHSGDIHLSDAIALHKMPEPNQLPVLEKAREEGWTHRRYLAELRYWTKNPFLNVWNDEDRERLKSRYHAFSFVNHPGTQSIMKASWKFIKKDMGLPGPFSCEATITIPATKIGFVCPHQAEWVVASVRTFEPTIPAEIIEGKPLDVEWIFLCEDCARLLFPTAEYQPDIAS